MNRRAFLAFIPVTAAAPVVAVVSSAQTERGPLPDVLSMLSPAQVTTAVNAVRSLFLHSGRVVIDNDPTGPTMYGKRMYTLEGTIIPYEEMIDLCIVSLSAVLATDDIERDLSSGDRNELTYYIIKEGERVGAWIVRDGEDITPEG